jgi:hypothetical protein
LVLSFRGQFVRPQFAHVVLFVFILALFGRREFLKNRKNGMPPLIFARDLRESLRPTFWDYCFDRSAKSAGMAKTRTSALAKLTLVQAWFTEDRPVLGHAGVVAVGLLRAFSFDRAIGLAPQSLVILF